MMYYTKVTAVVLATLIQMTIKITQKNAAFIVFWSSLIILFGKCFTCFDKHKNQSQNSWLTSYHNDDLINGHKNIWRSQPSINCQSLGNILICGATLFSANTFQRIYDLFPSYWVTVHWKDQILPISQVIFGQCCPRKILSRKQLNTNPIKKTRFVSFTWRRKIMPNT